MKKFEFECEVPGCDRRITVDVLDRPSTDQTRAEQEAHEGFSRQVRAHMSTHANTRYGGAQIPPGQRRKGPDED